MKNQARLACGLIALCALGTAFGACGGGGGEGTSSAPSGAGSRPSGTIEVWDIASGNFPRYDPVNRKLEAAFERKYPEVTIDHVAQPLEGYEALYQAAFTAHEGPDVMMMFSGLTGVLHFAKGLAAVNDRISPEMDEAVEGWETASADFDPGGDRYGVPIGAGGVVFYYNKALFAKAGLPREFEPETWEEVREAGEKLDAAGIQPFTGGDKEGYENGQWFAAAWPTKHSAREGIELGLGATSYTDPGVTEALEPQFEMHEAGLYPAGVFTTPLFPDGQELFAKGEGAMFLGLRSVSAYYGEFNEALGEENVGMFLPPGAAYVPVEADWVWSIPAFADNEDAAWAYLEFMASSYALQRWADAEVLIPNRADVSAKPTASSQARQLVDWDRELGTAPGMTAVTPGPVYFGPMASQALQGRTSLAAAQEAMQETAEKTSP